MSETTAPDANTLVSHEDSQGRTLTGMGADVEQLAETMDRHAPEPKTPDPVTEPTAATATLPAATEAPVSRGRQRFSDLTRERDEAKAAAEAAKSEREQLARERDELKQRLAQPAQSQQPAQPQSQPQGFTPTRPRPSPDEIGTRYDTYEDFTLDQTIWANEQYAAQQQGGTEQQIRAVLAAERSHAAFVGAVQSSQDRGRKAYKDFDEALKSPAGQIPLGPTYDEAMRRAAVVVQHPASEHIQYAILKTPGLAQSLQAADPVSFGMQIAALVPQTQPKAAWTPPPSPHPIVGASTATNGTPSSELAKKGDYEAYRAKRAAERGVKPRW